VCPASANWRETCEPMKPVPPITKIRMQEG
jgi:hypothetical protein